MYELFQFADEVGDLLLEHSPLSMQVVKRKILSFVRENGFLQHPVFLQIIGLYAGYSGKLQSANIFFEKSLDTAQKDDKISLLFNMGMFYLNMGQKKQAREIVKKLSKLSPRNNEKDLLYLELNVLERNWKEIFSELLKTRGATEELLKCILLAGILHKWRNAEYSRVIFHTRLSNLIQREARKGEENFFKAYQKSLTLLEFIAKRISPITYRAFIDYKNSEFILGKGEEKVLQFPR